MAALRSSAADVNLAAADVSPNSCMHEDGLDFSQDLCLDLASESQPPRHRVDMTKVCGTAANLSQTLRSRIHCKGRGSRRRHTTAKAARSRSMAYRNAFRSAGTVCVTRSVARSCGFWHLASSMQTAAVVSAHLVCQN